MNNRLFMALLYFATTSEHKPICTHIMDEIGMLLHHIELDPFSLHESCSPNLLCFVLSFQNNTQKVGHMYVTRPSLIIYI